MGQYKNSADNVHMGLCVPQVMLSMVSYKFPVWSLVLLSDGGVNTGGN